MATTGGPRIPRTATGANLGVGTQELTAIESATALGNPVQPSPKQIEQPEFIGLDHILPNRYKVITPSGSYYYVQAHDVIVCYSGPEQHLDSYYKFFNYVVWCQKDSIQTLTIAMIPKADVRAVVPAGVRYPNERAPERRVKD